MMAPARPLPSASTDPQPPPEDHLPPIRSLAIDPVRVMELRELMAGGDEGDLYAVLARLFLEDAPPRLAAMRNGVRRADMESIEREAHTLKGGSGTVGALGMAHLCDDLEALARSGTLTGASDLLARLEAEFHRVKVELRPLVGS